VLFLCEGEIPVSVRGIRGAITVEENTRKAILEASSLLLKEMIEANDLEESDLISIVFTMTEDLDQAFPAEAARKIGFDSIPLLCAQELDIDGALNYCIRILIHANSTSSSEKIRHIYLRKAVSLRPDLN